MQNIETTFSKRIGKCLCGKVVLRANKASNKVWICHCSMCRKRSGGPAFAIDCGNDLSVQGQEYITIYNSSAWGERAFCNQCGSNLYYRLKEQNQFFVAAGLFDQDKDFILDHEIFIDDKPNYYEFKDDTIKLTGAEIFAKAQGNK